MPTSPLVPGPTPYALPVDLERTPALRQILVSRLQAFDIQAAPASSTGELRHAAVCVAIIDEGHGGNLPSLRAYPHWRTQAALLLTRRTGHLRNHAGQWALPGGRIDVGETPEQAALREMREEVNLPLEADAVLGRLDDFVTRSGYLITPVVVWAGAAKAVVANPDEVASIHRIALAEFLRADAPMLAQETHSDQQVLRMPVGDTWIAAPTAAIIYQFRELCLLGRSTRVAHFEQPEFAWK